ncbi:MAG: hypothetical protein A2168_04765 [Planctomycetes bacterium RBG_13_50_24]|nr:MAG: hypothetical protein A2168_04765 [Planctomycetes bacterium RBG_13_50_24]
MSKPKTTPTKANFSKRKFPEPGKETREVFCAALSLAADLIKSKGLRIVLDPSGRVDIALDQEKLKAIPKSKFKESLSFEHFFSLVGTEFESLVEAAISSDPIHGLESEIPSKILSEVGKDEFLWRLRQVEKELLPIDIKERALHRRTTQGFVLQNITWQIVVKRCDQSEGKLPDIPYGCLSMVYASPQTTLAPLRLRAKGVSMELPTVREPKQLVLELHENDVQDMIESLKDLRENLQKLKKEK